MMRQSTRVYCWVVVCATAAILASQLASDPASISLVALLFWVILLMAVDLLPVSLGYNAEVMLGIPILLAIALLFQPWIAMTIAGLGAIDLREFRREIPLSRAAFNRAQLMLAVGATSALLSPYRSLADEKLFRADVEVFLIVVVVAAAAATHVLVNLSLVSLAIHFDGEVRFHQALQRMLPNPVAGFLMSYVVLSALGVVTALAYKQLGAFAAAAILIPTIFARISLIGARTQQELSERVRKQQHELLQATEKVFQERENERKRIAADIHDSSLQMLAAASYSSGNAAEFLASGRTDSAASAVQSARDALNEAIKSLRDSLVDLRRSSVEEGGLMTTIEKFADQMSTLWGSEIHLEGKISNEPPIPVALAAFQILQEGVVNAMKHGGGAPVIVKMSDHEDGQVHIVVEDDGPGFNPEADPGIDHVGVRLMKERAARVGGHVSFHSDLGRGTRVEAILPGGVSR
jgi:signal transduction histidine kinase